MSDKPSLSPIMRLVGNLHYYHKFGIISLFFGLAISLALFFLSSFYITKIGKAQSELAGNEYQNHVEKILYDVLKHNSLSREFIEGNKSVKGEIISLESQINSNFRALINFDEDTENLLLTTNAEFERYNLPNIKPIELERKWDEIARNIFETTTPENEAKHLKLIENLFALNSYIGKTSRLRFDSQSSTQFLITTTNALLPQAQEIIAKVNTIAQNQFKDKNELLELLGVLRQNLEQTNVAITSSYDWDPEDETQKDDLENRLSEPLRQYLNIAHNYITFTYESFQKEGNENQQELLALGSKTLNDNFNLWQTTSEELRDLLNRRIVNAQKGLLWRVATVIFLTLGAFLIGVHVLGEAIRPIFNLLEAMKKLAAGNLTVRVPVIFDDTIGQLSRAINTVADSFQQIISQLQWTGIQLTTSTTQIAAAAKQQEATVIQQEATTKEIAVTAREISATAKDFAKTMSDVSQSAEETSTIAEKGKEALEQMQTIMQQLVEASGTIASKLGALNEKAGTITGVVTTITKVADQTNLLSLNAAIEAEKAGEHGRSFAVIAREIRRLADQTANATYDIEKMVTEMVSAVSAGVMGVDKFTAEIHNAVAQVTTVSEHLTRIIAQVQQQTQSFENVNQGMQAQSLGAEQINESIIQLTEVAQQTSDSIRQFHKAIEQLNNAAQEMQTSVVKLKQ